MSTINKNKKTINVSQVLVVRPPDRSPQDIGKWRDAMKSAERGRRSRLYDLYDDLFQVDPVLGSVAEQRIDAITNAELKFLKPNGEDVPEMEEFIDTLEFEEFLKEIILTKFYGISVIELNFTPDFKPFSIPRKHIDIANKQILIDLSNEKGIPYEDNEFFLALGKEKDLGIFLRTAVYAIYKRNGGADYAQFCELFGIPTLAGLYDPDDETGRVEMEEAFQKRGSGGSIVMSRNGDIKTIGSEAAGNTVVHKEFLALCDEQMTIAVLGQTMTTKDGSSLAQGKVHAQTEDDINKADIRYVRRVLNQYFVPFLEKRGFPTKGGKFIFAEKGENIGQVEKLAMAEKIDDRTIVGIDEDWWFEEFGFPKGKRTAVKDRKPKVEGEDEEEEIEDEKKPKKKVSAKKLSLVKRVTDFFGQAPM